MRTHTRRIISLVLTFAFLLGMVPAYAVETEASGRYRDTAGHWAEEAIDTWSDYGIVEGYDGMFRPDDPVTRGEVAQIITNLLGLTEAKENSFTDLEDNAWYAGPVLKCAAAGIMVGDGATVRPKANMTREEAMTMLTKVLDIQPEEDGDLSAFSDAGQVSQWARGYVAAMTGAGIVKGMGDGTVAPKRNVTRAEIIAILNKAVSGRIFEAGRYAMNAGNGGAAVLVTTDGATLTGTISGRLVVIGGAAGGTLTLDGVTAEEICIVASDVTLILKNNSDVGKLVVEDSASGAVINQSANSSIRQLEPLEDTQIVRSISGGGSGGGSSTKPDPIPDPEPTEASDLAASEAGIHIGAVNEEQHVVALNQAPTYIYTVDTGKGEGYTILQVETVAELLDELSAPEGELSVLASDGTEKAASDAVVAGDIIRITAADKVTDYTVETRQGAVRGEAEAITPVVTAGTASDIVLYLTAGLRGPQTQIVVYVPAGIHATMDNTTVDVIGRGTVTLSELSTQSMGKTFSEYDHDAVGQVSIKDQKDGSQIIVFTGLDLRALNDHDLELTFKDVVLDEAGEYSFGFYYKTSAVTEENGLLPSYEKQELPALMSPLCQVTVEAVSTVSSFAREVSAERIYDKNTDYQSAVFTWTEPVGADSVSLLYSTDQGQTWDTYAAANGGRASVSGLTANTEYWFKLSVSGGENAGDSNIAKVYTGMLDVRDFGAVAGDGANDRDAIDAAIQYLYELGGGTLLFTDGTYDMNTVHLKSNVYLYIDSSATLRALKNADAPETTWWSDKDYRSGTSATSTGPYNDPNNYLTKQDVGHTYFRNCMFFAEREDNIKIIGNGTITGNGNLNTGDGVMNNSADNRADKMFVMKLCTNIEIGGLTKGDSISDYDLWYYETDTPNSDQPFYVDPEKAIDKEYIENALMEAGVSVTSPTREQLDAIDGIDTDIDNMLHIARAGHFVLLATGTDGIDTHDVYADKGGGVRDIFDYMESGDVRAINIYAEGSSDDIVKPGSDCSLGFTRPVSTFKVRNIIGDTNCNLFQIGSETADDIQNIYIDNIYVLAGNKAGFSISTNDGAYVKNIFLNAGGTNPDNLENPDYVSDGSADTSVYAKTSEMRRTRAPFFVSISNRGRTMGGAATRYSYDDGTGKIVNQLLSDNVAIGRVENIMIHNVNIEEVYGGSRYNSTGGRWQDYASQNKAAPIISGYAVPTVFEGDSKPAPLPVLNKDGSYSYDGSRQTGYIENIVFTDVDVLVKGGNTLENGEVLTPEMAVGKYNVGDLALDAMGTGLPAYGFWFRHVENLTMENCSTAYEKSDDRYAVVFDDVLGANVTGLSMQRGENNRNLIQVRNSSDISVSDSSYYLAEGDEPAAITLSHETVAGKQTYPYHLSSSTKITAGEGIVLDGSMITVPFGTTVKELREALAADDGSSQTYTVANRADGDLLESNDVLTVTAEDGTKAEYTVIVRVSSSTDIVAEIGDVVFGFEGTVLSVNKDRVNDLISVIASADGSVQTYQYADGVLTVTAADGTTSKTYTVNLMEDLRLTVKEGSVQVIEIDGTVIRALRGTTAAQLEGELAAPEGASLTVTADSVTVSKNGESLVYSVVYEASLGGGGESIVVEGETGTYTKSGITGDKTNNSDLAHGGQDRQFTGPAGAYVDYTVTVPASGNYTLTYGYKLKTTARTITDVLVNGVKVGEVNHLTSNSAEENLYTSSEFEVGRLNAGEVTVRFLITGSTNSFMVDYFSLNSTGAASGSTNIEADGMVVDNDAKTLTAGKRLTVSDLLALVAACDGSAQTYRITDALGTDKTEGQVENGDILIVTAQDEAHIASYAISGVPALSNSTQITAVDESVVTVQENAITIFEGTTAAEVKAALAAADDSEQTYVFSCADDAAVTAEDTLTVTAEDGVTQATYTVTVLEIPFELVIAETAQYTREIERFAVEADGERNSFNAILTPGVTAGDIKNEIVSANSKREVTVKVLDGEDKPLTDTDLVYEGDTIVFTSDGLTITMTAMVYYDYRFATGESKAARALSEALTWENCTVAVDSDNLNANSLVADVIFQPYAKSTKGAGGGWFQLTGQVALEADYRLDYVYKGQAGRGAVSLYLDGGETAVFSDFSTTTDSVVPADILYKQYLGVTKYAVKSVEDQHFASGEHSFRFTTSDDTQVLSVAVQLHMVRK